MNLDQAAMWVGHAVMVCSAVLAVGGLFGIASFYVVRWFVRGTQEWALLIEFLKWRQAAFSGAPRRY